VRLVRHISLLVVLTAGSLAFAFPGWQRRGAAPPAQHQNSPQNNSQPAYHLNGPGPHRGDWLRKYGSLPPNQQEKQLRSDPGFRSLPQQKQNELVNRLREFNSRPPEQKQQILNRMETFEHMSPQQQQQARNLFSQYRAMPEDQRNKVSQAYRRLRGMPPSARNELLNSDEFKNNYTPEQRDLLRGMTDLNLTPTR
jgi:hypothetical protein